MSRKSGNRFSEKDMRHSTNLERIPIQPNRDALQTRVVPYWGTGGAAQCAQLSTEGSITP